MNPCMASQQSPEVAVKPFAYCYNELCMVLEASGGCVNPLLMVWNLQEVAVKQFTHFYHEILMVLESSRSCREAMIDGLDSPGGCCEYIYTLFT